MARRIKTVTSTGEVESGSLPQNASFTCLNSKCYAYTNPCINSGTSQRISPEILIMSCDDWTPSSNTICFQHDFFKYRTICLKAFWGGATGTCTAGACVRVGPNSSETCEIINAAGSYRVPRSCGSFELICCAGAWGSNVCCQNRCHSISLRFEPSMADTVMIQGANSTISNASTWPFIWGSHPAYVDQSSWSKFCLISLYQGTINCTNSATQSFAITGIPCYLGDITG